MKISPLVAVYSITLLLSATLLFSVQPMFSKMVLPLLGGTPAVWNTAMMFFQVMLLGGYAYTHGTTRFLGIRTQAVLHIILLIVFTIVLPIAIPPDAIPPAGQNPVFWQLALMTMTIGGPFFVLAGSAPMLQRWFTVSDHKDAGNPYFLYSASNLGSMTALLAYPVLLEPIMTLSEQSYAWMYGYFALIAFTVLSAGLIWRHSSRQLPAALVTSLTDDKPITWQQRSRWLILSFIPSSLMLGVTTFITMDIAAVPLLWVLPLAAYVGTFIIVFARKQMISLKDSAFYQGAALIVLVAQKIAMPSTDVILLVTLHIILFFLSALTCHLELARARPSARHITEFYLFMSIGGALGGFFNAIIAPIFLIIPVEFFIMLIAACLVRYHTDPGQKISELVSRIKNNVRTQGLECFSNIFVLSVGLVLFMTALVYQYPSYFTLFVSTIIICVCLSILVDKRWLFTFMIAYIFLFFPLGYIINDGVETVLYRNRNFFGVLKIVDDTRGGERSLLNGTTNHGTQSTPQKERLIPLSYYSASGPLIDVIDLYNSKPGSQHFGAIGLGVGAVACHAKKDRHYDFYEINALVKDIAENPSYFTFLKDCGSPYKVILGDGRLTLQKAPNHFYDVMIIDAFTSDNIPIHLLTIEALTLYMQKIKEDGVLLIHISNRFLDLEPVLQKASEKMNVPAVAKSMERSMIPGTNLKSYGSHWVSFSNKKQNLDYLRRKGWDDVKPRRGVKLWTDQYSNIFSVLNNKTALERAHENFFKKEEEKKSVTP